MWPIQARNDAGTDTVRVARPAAITPGRRCRIHGIGQRPAA
jgi:hypothetical protein